MADKKKPKKMSLSDFNKQVGGAPNDEQIALPTAPRRGEEDGQEPNAWGGNRSYRGRDREAPSYFERSSRFGDSSFGGERAQPAQTGEEPRRSWNDREERPREFSTGSRDFTDREPREIDRRGPPRERMDRDTGPPRSYRSDREPTADAPRANTEDYPPLNDKERPKLNILKKGEEPENPLPKPEPKVDKPRKANKPDPFGGAKPREEVIKEKGLTDLDKEVEKKLAEKPKLEEVQGTLEKLEVNDKLVSETDKEIPQENESHTRRYSPPRRRLSPPSRDRSYSDRGGRYNDREPRSYRDSGDRGGRGGRRFSPPRDNDRNFGGERRNYNDRESRSYGDRGGNRNFDGDRGGNRNFDGDRGGNRNFGGRDRSPTRYNDREPRSYRDSGDRGGSDRGGRHYSPSRDRGGSGGREYRGGSGGGRFNSRDNGGDRGRNYSSNRGRYNDGGAPRSDSPPAAARGGSESPSKNEPTFDSLPKRDDNEY